MIPLKTAINNGIWLVCYVADKNENRVFDIRLRVVSFAKVNFTDVDNPEKVKFRDEGIYWIMKFEVMNLLKIAISTASLRKLILMDQDGFSFEVKHDSHLGCHSQYAEQSGLYRFYADELRPKMKVTGALSYLLPDDDFAEYMIAVNGGIVREA